MSFTQELLLPASDMLQNSLKIPLPWANQPQEPSGLCRQSYVSIYISHFCSPQACDFHRVGFPEPAPSHPHLTLLTSCAAAVPPPWSHRALLGNIRLDYPSGLCGVGRDRNQQIKVQAPRSRGCVPPPPKFSARRGTHSHK